MTDLRDFLYHQYSSVVVGGRWIAYSTGVGWKA